MRKKVFHDPIYYIFHEPNFLGMQQKDPNISADLRVATTARYLEAEFLSLPATRILARDTKNIPQQKQNASACIHSPAQKAQRFATVRRFFRFRRRRRINRFWRSLLSDLWQMEHENIRGEMGRIAIESLENIDRLFNRAGFPQ
jgi:hypothetical protein